MQEQPVHEQPDSHDVVIVGGGGMGSSVAFHLAEASPGCRVAVIERDSNYEEASTMRASTGGVRRVHALPENIALSDYGIAFLETFAQRTAVDGEGLGCDFVQGGYLLTAAADAKAGLAANFEFQSARGVEARWMEPADVAAAFPSIRTDNLGAAVHSPKDGWADPRLVLRGLRRKAESLGVRYVDDEVVGFETQGKRVRSVTLRSGGTMKAPAFVVAAGPWSGRVCELAGVKTPLGPLLRYDFEFEIDRRLEPLPFVKDWARVAFRPCVEAGRYRGGLQTTEMSRGFDLAIDPTFFHRRMMPALVERSHAFEGARLTGAVSGLFDQNEFDQNAIIGPCTGTADNLYLIAGFSGHGFMHVPGAGRAIAELILHGRYQSIDLGELGWDRIVANRPYTSRRQPAARPATGRHQ
jgi:FAD-dependent oxidoreductase domain-containing protein 1